MSALSDMQRAGPSRGASAGRRTVARVVLALLVFGAAPARGQSGVGTWLSYSAAVRASQVSVALDVQLRSHDAARDFEQAALRAGVAVVVGRVTLVGGGFAALTERAGTPDDPAADLRLYQDAMLRHRAGPVRVAHRVRAEELLVGGVRLRGRYQLSATLPLAGDAVRRGSVYAVVSAEPFLRGPGRRGQAVFDRARLTGGVGVRTTDRFGVRASVVAQVYAERTDVQVQLSLHHALDF